MSDRAVVLIVDPQPDADSAIDRLTRAVHAAGGTPCLLRSVEVIGSQAPEHVPGQPAVVVLGPNALHPLLLSRQLHRTYPSAHLVFVAPAHEEASLRRRLSYGAPPNSQWTAIRADSADLDELLGQAIRVAHQARQLRTTLDRMNLRLAAPAAVDTRHYRQLVVSDRYLAAILTHAHDAIVSIDKRGFVQTWNRGAERLFGIDTNDAVGRPFTAVTPWPPQVPEALEQAIAGQALRCEWRLDLPAGTVHVEAALSPVRDDSARPIGVAAIIRDVTALRQLVDSLREADRHKNEFLAMLAHELRNPLAPVLNATKLLERKESLSETGRHAVRIIDRQVRHMKRLIDDLLEVSGITRGLIELKPEPMLLGTAISNAVEAALPAFDSKRQTLTTRLPEHPVRLVADPVRVAQILENLLSNASKYTPDGGAIRIEANESPGAVEFRVIDNGIGIEPAKLESVFELFVQAQPGVGEHQGGLGIGLALVRRLVEMHSGTVTAFSRGLGQGATLTVRLPTAPGGDVVASMLR